MTIFMRRSLIFLCFFTSVSALSPVVLGQESTLETDSEPTAAQQRAEAEQALAEICERLKIAKVSRATVELTTRSKIGTEVLQNELAVYQIASTSPNKYSAYLKAPDGSFRIFCDGTDCQVWVSPTDYYKAIVPGNLQEVVTNLPVPLGPYPEPVLALTLCGVDPAKSLLMDMESVQVIDRQPYAGKPAVHLRGVQVDGVIWDLWLGTDKENLQPLRMLIDLTEVVVSGNDAEFPENFAYELEFLFTLWRTTGEVSPTLFSFNPPAGTTEHESLEAFYESMADEAAKHELIGQPAPDVEATLLPAKVRDTEAKTIKLRELKGKIVVIDIWATWCAPCIQAMPIIESVTKKFAERNVQFFALNTGETEEAVAAFLATAKVRPDVLLDPTGDIANQFKAEAIPQTVIIGKDGIIQTVNVGYSSLESLEKELTEQLEVLASGGSLLTEPEDE